MADITTTKTLKTLIIAAAEAGSLTLGSIDGGEDFETIAEWLEYAGEREIEDVATAAGLTEGTTGADIHELNHQMARQRASDKGII